MGNLGKNRLYVHRPSSIMVNLFSVRGPIDPDAWAKAIKRAMACYPALCRKLVQSADGSAEFLPLDEPVVVTQVEKYEPATSDDEETLLETAFDWVEEAVAAYFPLDEGEFIHHVLVTDGVDSVWGIASHYLGGDAYSICYLAQKVFDLLDQPDLEVQVVADLPGPSEGTDWEQGLNFLQKRRLQTLNKDWRKNQKVFTVQDFQRMHKNFHEAYHLQACFVTLEPDFVQGLQAYAHKERVRFSALIAAAAAKATQERDPLSIQISTRPDDYRGVGTFLGGTELHVTKNRNEVLALALAFSQEIDKALEDVSDLHHSAIVLSGLDDTLIDAGYYAAFDGLVDKSAQQIQSMYGLSHSGNGTQVNNLKVVPLRENYSFGHLENQLLLPPMAPNFARMLGIATVGDRMSITNSFYQDAAYEQQILQDLVRYLRDLIA